MIEVFLDTELNKINTQESINNLYAGIIYDKSGEPQSKILFKKINNRGYNVFNSDSYLIDEEDVFYISNTISLKEIILHFLQKHELNLAELYLVYKMFINDESFINKHLLYFRLHEVSVGYKGKTEIRSTNPGYVKKDNEKYYALKKIINYKKLKQGNIKKYERKQGK